MPAKPIEGTLRTQARNNRNTAANTDWYAGHRSHLMQLLDQLAPAPGGRLMVLGAGNANDLELPALCHKFREVHLVDLDASALQRARAKVPPETANLFLHGNLDLTDAGARSALPGNLDLVLSACVFSQITFGLQADDRAPIETLEAILAARADHFRFMAECLRPGGTALFVSDLVSSDTVPELARIPAPALRQQMERLVVNGNFFTGLNPTRILEMLMMDQAFRDSIQAVTFVDPWCWQLSSLRSYLVYGIHFRKQPA